LEGYYAYNPNPLPPKIDLNWELVNLLSEADRAMSELSGAGQLLPNPHLLIRPYLRREAILSSRIEDTHADMEELAVLEEGAAPDPRQGALEVANYVRAMDLGLARMKEIPISTRLIKELHAVLLMDVRGGESTKTPGEFRRSQNWIGPQGCTLSEASFVPPPYEEIGPALGAWENYVNNPSREPPLIKAALMHYQFETIHPFLDGNGRIGRLLITLYLCSAGCLSMPLLYLSGFFDDTRDEYYRLLMNVSSRGEWREWVEYFLRGVRQQARYALDDTNWMLAQHKHWETVAKEGKRIPGEAARMLERIFANPVVSISRYAERNGISYLTAQKAVEFWENKGLLKEFSGQKRNRLYAAFDLLNIMNRPRSQPVDKQQELPFGQG
jgi:Fic family protein